MTTWSAIGFCVLWNVFLTVKLFRLYEHETFVAQKLAEHLKDHGE